MMKMNAQPGMPPAQRYALLAIMATCLVWIVWRPVAPGVPPSDPEDISDPALFAAASITAAAKETMTGVDAAGNEEGEADLRRMMRDQVYLLRAYAGVAGEDDPFSLTEEQIQEFQKRGSPVVW